LPKTNLLMLGAALGALAIAAPGVATADSAPSPGGMSYADPAAPTVFADGSTLTAPLGSLVGSAVEVHGTLAGSKPGDTVAVQRLDAVDGWTTAATTVVAPDGSYDATWTADPASAGKTTVRAVPASSGQATTAGAGATPAPAAPEGRTITLYRRAKATWYGPGFYGRKTACGKRMSKTLLGVANKTLPCGTLVDLYNNGVTVTVPVVDRGPFRKGTSYDLTLATARALGVTATATIGAVRSAPVAPAAAAASSR
jgi:rare lipoprotein A